MTSNQGKMDRGIPPGQAEQTRETAASRAPYGSIPVRMSTRETVASRGAQMLIPASRLTPETGTNRAPSGSPRPNRSMRELADRCSAAIGETNTTQPSSDWERTKLLLFYGSKTMVMP